MSDKMREEFEAWAKRHHGVYSIGSVGAHYSNENVQRDWIIWCLAWQASRAALVVELPVVFMPTCSDDFNEGCHAGRLTYRDAVIDALDEAGVGYK